MLFCYSSGTVATSQSNPDTEAATDTDHDHDVSGTALTDCCECSNPEELSGSSVDDAQSLSNSIDSLVILTIYIVKLQYSIQLTPDVKYYLHKHYFVHNKTYNFLVHSVGDHNRKFERKWLDAYNVLFILYQMMGDTVSFVFCFEILIQLKN